MTSDSTKGAIIMACVSAVGIGMVSYGVTRDLFVAFGACIAVWPALIVIYIKW